MDARCFPFLFPTHCRSREAQALNSPRGFLERARIVYIYPQTLPSELAALGACYLRGVVINHENRETKRAKALFSEMKNKQQRFSYIFYKQKVLYGIVIPK